MKVSSAKSKSWIRRRHKVVFFLVRPILRIYYRFSYNYRGERYRAEDPHQPYLILANHNGAVDPILLAFSFRQVIYFVASDHIFRWGLASKLIKYLAAPIPIVKAQLDLKAIRQMRSICQEGGTIGLFPSGNGSFAGPEMPIHLGTAKLAKVLKLPILLFRFEGGYLSRPRWGVTTRKGAFHGKVVRELSVSEIEAMDPDVLLALIQQELNADPYQDQSNCESLPLYKGKRLAEYLERVLFLCPQCRQLNTLRSHDDRLFCDCGFKVRYGEDGHFHPDTPNNTTELAPLPHVKAFDQFQLDYLSEWLSQADVRMAHQVAPFFSDESETLSVVQRAMDAEQSQTGQLALYSDRLAFKPSGADVIAFPIEQIRFVVVHGPQTLQFQDARTDQIYEIKSECPRSAYRYKMMIERLKR